MQVEDSAIPTAFQATGALKILFISPHFYVITHNGYYTLFRTILWVHRILPRTISSDIYSFGSLYACCLVAFSLSLCLVFCLCPGGPPLPQ